MKREEEEDKEEEGNEGGREKADRGEREGDEGTLLQWTGVTEWGNIVASRVTSEWSNRSESTKERL